MTSLPSTPRNAPCPCGSGRKYKQCCGSRLRSFASRFQRLPLDVKVYYLDTCVWGGLKEAEIPSQTFVAFFQPNVRVAAVSQYSLIELSRAPGMFGFWDNLFFAAQDNIFIPMLYDQVVEGELRCFPNSFRMSWLPLSLFFDRSNHTLLGKLTQYPEFASAIDDHLAFSDQRFMHLEEMKENFPPGNGERYEAQEASTFAFGVTVEYLSRHFPDFLTDHQGYVRKRLELATSRIPSVWTRSLFVFYKYYLHGQSPGPSDFIDFAHTSYAPYCDVFVTERNVCNTLSHMRNLENVLCNTEIIHVNDFIKIVREYSGDD